MKIRLDVDPEPVEEAVEDNNLDPEESAVRLHTAFIVDESWVRDGMRSGFRFQRCGGGRRVIHKHIGGS